MSKKEIQKSEETTEEPKQTPIALEDLKCGYVVGISEEEGFIFEVFGKKKGLVELMGVHQHASYRIETVYKHQQISGDRLVQEVGRAVSLIGEKVDSLLDQKTPAEEVVAE